MLDRRVNTGLIGRQVFTQFFTECKMARQIKFVVFLKIRIIFSSVEILAVFVWMKQFHQHLDLLRSKLTWYVVATTLWMSINLTFQRETHATKFLQISSSFSGGTIVRINHIAAIKRSCYAPTFNSPLFWAALLNHLESVFVFLFHSRSGYFFVVCTPIVQIRAYDDFVIASRLPHTSHMWLK